MALISRHSGSSLEYLKHGIENVPITARFPPISDQLWREGSTMRRKWRQMCKARSLDQRIIDRLQLRCVTMDKALDRLIFLLFLSPRVLVESTEKSCRCDSNRPTIWKMHKFWSLNRYQSQVQRMSLGVKSDVVNNLTLVPFDCI